jgi:hypothetical protein
MACHRRGRALSEAAFGERRLYVISRRFSALPQILSTKFNHSSALVFVPKELGMVMSKNLNKTLSPFLTSVQEIALDMIFAFYGESRINRTYEEYRAIAVRCPRKLEALHSIVNEMLKEPSRAGITPYEICRFKAGDYGHFYEPFPTSLSFETVRQAWLRSGMRALQLEGRKLSA